MTVRAPAVAGLFYPGVPGYLRTFVVDALDQARTLAGPGEEAPPRALIVPHAGYVYSGTTAATAYHLLKNQSVKHVVIVGPTHRVGINGIALPDADAMATPLGEVPLWQEGVALALAQPGVCVSEPVHRQEHAIEVHLPFLQVVLPDVDILPLAAGWVEPTVMSNVIEAVWQPGTVVIVSSDLSHYLPYAEAQAVDAKTMRQILALTPDLGHDQACGATGINGLLRAAAHRSLVPRLVHQCNSGDTAGDKESVVGYATVAFREAVA